jgi:hypothetical protein
MAAAQLVATWRQSLKSLQDCVPQVISCRRRTGPQLGHAACFRQPLGGLQLGDLGDGLIGEGGERGLEVLR